MAVAVRQIGREEKLTVVGHLEELRARLIVSLAALAVAFGVCMWQNHALLRFIDAPLAHQTQKQVRAGNGPLGATYTVQRSARTVASQLQVVVGTLERPGSGATAQSRALLFELGLLLASVTERRTERRECVAGRRRVYPRPGLGTPLGGAGTAWWVK